MRQKDHAHDNIRLQILIFLYPVFAYVAALLVEDLAVGDASVEEKRLVDEELTETRSLVKEQENQIKILQGTLSNFCCICSLLVYRTVSLATNERIGLAIARFCVRCLFAGDLLSVQVYV